MRPVHLIQISDLHFVEDLFETGSNRHSQSFRCKSHSADYASLLGDTVALLDNGIDLLAVTGDVATDGSDGALLSAVAAPVRWTD